jgi:hypothetical protein
MKEVRINGEVVIKTLNRIRVRGSWTSLLPHLSHIRTLKGQGHETEVKYVEKHNYLKVSVRTLKIKTAKRLFKSRINLLEHS